LGKRRQNFACAYRKFPGRLSLAIEASLKNNLNDILVETLDDLKNGIKYLKDNEVGKASFYVSGLMITGEKLYLKKFKTGHRIKKPKSW